MTDQDNLQRQTETPKEKRATLWDWMGRILPLVAIALSTFAAIQSRSAAEASRDQSAYSILMQSRLQALKQYNLSYGDLDSAVTAASVGSVDVGIDLEEPDQIKTLSLADAKKISVPNRGVYAAFRKYEAEVNASRGIWPDDLEEQIRHAGEDASTMVACFSEAGNPPMIEAELQAKRAQLFKDCQHLETKVHNFRNASNAVINRMVAETRASLRKVGADWGNATPSDEVSPNGVP